MIFTVVFVSNCAKRSALIFRGSVRAVSSVDIMGAVREGLSLRGCPSLKTGSSECVYCIKQWQFVIEIITIYICMRIMSDMKELKDITLYLRVEFD